MDSNSIHQPEHHFRFFDTPNEPKKILPSMNNYEETPLVTLEQAIEPLVVFVPEVKYMVELVKEKCQQPKDSLSTDESASIMLYTMEWTPKEESFYFIFNRKLQSEDADEIIPWYCYLRLISTSISKLPVLSSQILYRGMKVDSKNDYYLGKSFFWYGFSSCSSSIEILDKDEVCFGQTGSRTLFIIHGDHGKNISQHSFYKIKNEILLPPGQRFKVMSCRKSNNQLRVIILREISYLDSIPSIPVMIPEKQDCKSFDLIIRERIKKRENYLEVNLRQQKLTDNHMDIVVKRVIKKKQCVWLSLQNNQITSKGLSILANGLDKNISLETLYLSQNFITDIGVRSLTNILSNDYSNLTMLSLDRNRIKDEGAHYLANMLETNKTLTDLWLSYNEIGDLGVKSLANVLSLHNETLIQLYLDGNKLVSDLSVDSLVCMLITNRSLNTVCVHECSLSQEGKAKLEKRAKSRKVLDLYV